MTRNLKYTYWRDGEFVIGFLNDYPDYRTQGTSKDHLVENLKSLLEDIESDEIPFIRKVEELSVAW
ncbi:MAG: type II toxin-antitoxin system HicB family antitoxin, partial [Gammaproteobacteria bacterium]